MFLVSKSLEAKNQVMCQWRWVPWHYTKVVLQTRIFFSGQPLFSNQKKKIRVCRTTFLQPEKRWVYSINPPVFLVNHLSRTRKKVVYSINRFLVNHFSRITILEPLFLNHFSQTTFLEPLFSNHLEKWLQIKWPTVICLVLQLFLKYHFSPLLWYI